MKISQFLEQNPDFQIHLAARRGQIHLDEALEKFDLNLIQALILTALYFESDHQSAFEDLVSAFAVTKGGLSQHLSQLESMGLIRRKQKIEDKRSIQIVLREEAFPLCLKLIEVFEHRQTSLEKKYGTKDIQNFLNLLKEIAFT